MKYGFKESEPSRISSTYSKQVFFKLEGVGMAKGGGSRGSKIKRSKKKKIYGIFVLLLLKEVSEDPSFPSPRWPGGGATTDF